MPVDKQMADAILGTFRNMMQDCQDKKMSGADLDVMEQSLNRMEELAELSENVGAFSGQMMQEGLYMKFSDHYGKLLLSASQPVSQNNNSYNEATDQALLKQTVQAYTDAIERLRSNKAQAKARMGVNEMDAVVLIKDETITAILEKIIQKSKPGPEGKPVSYPGFLVEMMKEGLDRMFEGSVITRDSHIYHLDSARAMANSPYHIKVEEEKLALLDSLCGHTKTGFPDLLEYTLGCEKIDWKYLPAINKWFKIKQGRSSAEFMLDEWATSFCAFAPSIEPWAQAKNPKESVIESQECVPGKLRVHEKINQTYFDLSVQGLFQHESFDWDLQYHWLGWSPQYIDFLLTEVEPICQPGTKLPGELIRKAEAFHLENRKMNPHASEPSRRYAIHFDNYFGEGEYQKRYG